MPKYTSVFVLSVLLFILFLFPAYYTASPPKGYVYTGVHSDLNSLDSFFQLEVVHQGWASNSWLAENVYSTETPAVQRFLIFYTAIGKLGRLIGIDWIILYHFIRAIGVFSFVWILFWFIGLFRVDWQSRWFILVLTIFSGALWQVYWPESSIFCSLYNPPHIAFALSLQLLTLGFFWTKRYWHSGVFLFALGWIHPYDSLLVLALIIITSCRSIRRDCLVVSLVGVLPLLFHFYWSYSQIMAKGISIDDNWVLPWSLPIYLGLNLFAVIGVSAAKSRISPEKQGNQLSEQLLYAWLLLGLVMLYMPFYFRRRLFLGVPIALGILSGGLLWSLLKSKLVNSFYRSIFPLLLCSFFVLTSWTSFALITKDCLGIWRREFPYFLRDDTMSSLIYLESTPNNSIILAHPLNSIFIPVYSGRKIYVSDWLWTENKEFKKSELIKFFQKNTSTQWRTNFLKKNKINFLYYSKKEQELGKFRPAEAVYLKTVMKNSEAEIYQVSFK